MWEEELLTKEVKEIGAPGLENYPALLAFPTPLALPHRATGVSARGDRSKVVVGNGNHDAPTARGGTRGSMIQCIASTSGASPFWLKGRAHAQTRQSLQCALPLRQPNGQLLTPGGIGAAGPHRPVGGKGLVGAIRILDPGMCETIWQRQVQRAAQNYARNISRTTQTRPSTARRARKSIATPIPHLSKGLLLFTGAPILKARMATASAVLMRGLAQNLALN